MVAEHQLRRVRVEEDLPGEVLEAHHARVEGLVGVEVDAHGGLGGDLEQGIGGRLDPTVGFEMRTAPDEIGAEGQGIAQERAVVGAGAEYLRLSNADELASVVLRFLSRRQSLGKRLAAAG